MPDISRQEVLAKVTEIAERIGDSLGIEIVEVQVQGGGKARVVRIYIDRLQGVTHTDCQLVSNQVGAVLDAEDVVPDASYTLEVSSPGVERKLSKPRDFERFTGQKAKVSLREPVENQRHWEGILRGFEDGVILMEAAGGKYLNLPFSQVEKANLKFEW
jgi:ribosome maturation factor RimP